MPPKMYNCTLCGNEVSRRQSLSLKSLGGGDGRACRDHDLVVQLLEQQRQASEKQFRRAEEERVIRDVSRTMRIMQGTALVRMMHSIHGTSPERIYAQMRFKGWPREDIEEVRQQVADQGGPQMSEDEIQEALFMAVHLTNKGLIAKTG
ncbi:hypothetical protein HON36_02435 [Candidatus Parcubacteria bacterium]|mgnify:FL=1|jgi:hypothetical protein|nr:hypothetical protein [Candidatus Parcubacteria bacterium]MBT7227991.1 hypothetical protein [Candidatus Parcubacteria bacterium]